MSVNNDLKELIGEIDKTLALIDKSLSFHSDFQRRFVNVQGKEAAFAMTLSQVFIDFYTCLETLFSGYRKYLKTTFSRRSGIKAC